MGGEEPYRMSVENSTRQSSERIPALETGATNELNRVNSAPGRSQTSLEHRCRPRQRAEKPGQEDDGLVSAQIGP